MRTGKYETDEISVRSPSGKTKTIWLHSNAFNELSDSERKLYDSAADKIVAAIKEENEWDWKNKPDVYDKVKWSDYLEKRKKLFPPALGDVYVDLTYQEMEVIKKLADWKKKK